MIKADLIDQLSLCEAAELIRQVQVAPELEYWFKHTLVQEAAYESLLKSARAELHGRVAAAIEADALEPEGQREANAALLALHYEAAGMDAKALPYAIMAANRARRTYAHREAIALYDKALAIGARLNSPESRLALRTIYASRGKVFEVSGDSHAALDNYGAMLAEAELTGDIGMQADALNHRATVQSVMSTQADNLLSTLDAALDLARRSGEAVLIGRALWNMGLHNRFHDPLASIGYLEDALALAEATPMDPGMRELAAAVWNDLFISYWVVGQFRRGMAARMQAIAAFRELDNRPMLADALGGAAIQLHHVGDIERSRAFAAEGLAISQAVDNPWGVVFNDWSVQAVQIDTGAFESILENADRRLAAARRVGFPVFIGRALSVVARAHQELGRVDRIQRLAEEAAEFLSMQRVPIWSIEGRAVLGNAALARGDLLAAQEALEPIWREGDDRVRGFQGLLAAGPAYADWALTVGHLDQGLAFCDWLLGQLEPEGVWRCAGEIRYWRGRIHLARGDTPHAEADLLEARGRLSRAQAAVLVWKVDAALAELYRGRDDAPAAAAAVEESRLGITRLADGIRNQVLRRSFLERPDVREILA